MDRIMGQMTELALRYRARRLCLFGSRARGGQKIGSDYDFALWGVPKELEMRFRSAAEELPVLEKIDFVFVSDSTDPELLKNIKKDGVILMDRYEQKYSNYKAALERLREGVSRYRESGDDIVRDGVIQRFEFTCELAWKTVREYLIDQGYMEINSPKAVMRQALEDHLISDGAGWMALLTDRNRTSHIYDASAADEIAERIEGQYLLLFTALLEKLK